MGHAERRNHEHRALLLGLRVAVDVQHLWKPPPHHLDRGSRYTLGNGIHWNEADAALLYAAALVSGLRRRGARVLTNAGGGNGPAPDPKLIGYYTGRNLAAVLWGVHAYLACHVNSAGGAYALTEHLGPGEQLAERIVNRLVLDFPALGRSEVRTLRAGERGAICIDHCGASVAAVILEPFFGDTPIHQAMLSAPRLARLGESIAVAVSDWWLTKRAPRMPQDETLTSPPTPDLG